MSLMKQNFTKDNKSEEAKSSNVWSVTRSYDSDGTERINIISFPNQNAKYDCTNKNINISFQGTEQDNPLHLMGKCKSVVVMGVDIKLSIDETEYLRTMGSGAEIRANVVKELRDEGILDITMIQRVGDIYTRGYSSKIYYVGGLTANDNVKVAKYHTAEIYRVENLSNLEKIITKH